MYCVITLYMCYVDYVYSLKLYQIRIKVKCIQTSEFVKFSLSIFRFNTQEAQSDY